MRKAKKDSPIYKFSDLLPKELYTNNISLKEGTSKYDISRFGRSWCLFWLKNYFKMWKINIGQKNFLFINFEKPLYSLLPIPFPKSHMHTKLLIQKLCIYVMINCCICTHTWMQKVTIRMTSWGWAVPSSGEARASRLRLSSIYL